MSISNSLDTSEVASALVSARAVFARVLSDNPSLIAMDILLAVANYRPGFDGIDQTGDAPSVKWVFAAMPRSSRGVRLQFNRLVEDGLLDVKESEGDRRYKRVILSPAGMQLFEEVARAVRVHLPSQPCRIGGG